MEAPLGMNSDIYLGLQDKLAAKTRVCVYDRAGVGLSDRPVQPVVNMSATSGETSAAAITKIRRLRGHEFTVERFEIINQYIIFQSIVFCLIVYLILFCENKEWLTTCIVLSRRRRV
jgi:hypothetical protein